MESLKETLLRIEVKETSQSVFHWASLASISEDTKAQILGADVLLVPSDFKRDALTEPTFPSGTTTFFRDLKTSLNQGGLNIAIAIDPDDYIELDLHSDKARLAKAVVKLGALPLFLGVLSGLITTQISSVKPPTSVEMTLVVDNEKGKCISISYVGPPADLIPEFKRAVEKCLSEEPLTQGVVVVAEHGDDTVALPIPTPKQNSQQAEQVDDSK